VISMNALILSLVIQSWCLGYMENEYGEKLVWDQEQTGDFKSCLELTTEQDLFYYGQYTAFPDVRF
jgi:hypothetical protein